MTVFDHGDVVVDHLVARLEEGARHQDVLAEGRAREGVALPEVAAEGGRHVVEVVEEAALVGPHGLVHLRRRQGGLPATRRVAGVPRAEDLRQHLRVRTRDVATVGGPDRGVLEVADEVREPRGTARDRVLRQEHHQLAAGARREQVAGVPVVKLHTVDPLAPERNGEARGPLPQELPGPIGRARVNGEEVPRHIDLLRLERVEDPLQKFHPLPGGHEDGDARGDGSVGGRHERRLRTGRPRPRWGG